MFRREGTWLYVVRHAERLDTVFPNWNLIIRTEDQSRWPPGFREALPFPPEHISFLDDLHMIDTPLTARGCAQARATAESLRGAGIAHIFSSPMLRCMQTAHEFSAVLNLAIKVEPFAMETLDERWYPTLPTTLRWDAGGPVARGLGIRIDGTYKSPFAMPGRHERLSDWTERSIALLRQVTKDEFLAAGRVLVVTHGISVATLPWIALSEHPPTLGYCSLASLEKRPFTATVRIGTDQLEPALPATVSAAGVALWLAASAGMNVDESERIVAWRDLGPAAAHASQPREALRPRMHRERTLRRIAVAGFDGANDCLVAPVAGPMRSFTLAALVHPAAAFPDDVQLLLSADPLRDSNGLEIRVDKAGSVGVFAGEVAVAVARSSLAVERWSLIVLRVRNGREARVWVDFMRTVAGGSIPPGSPPFGAWQGFHLCGGSPSIKPFHGSVAEVLLLATALDDQAIDALHSYFISKFA